MDVDDVPTMLHWCFVAIDARYRLHHKNISYNPYTAHLYEHTIVLQDILVGCEDIQNKARVSVYRNSARSNISS